MAEMEAEVRSGQGGDAGEGGGASAGETAPVPGRMMITAALMMSMTVAALEQLVVSPALPTIISQLKGFKIYPWVVSIYLLAATVSTPLYGKLADIFGRKRILLFGLALFSAGSMLSGAAWSMESLIAMRAIQGLGAGAVMPIVLTLLGDLFTLEERARVQGLFSAVWGLSSIGGPIIGGWLTVEWGWRWVFFVSVPFALLAFLMLAFGLKERVERRRAVPIDWAGAVLLTLGLCSLLLIVLDGAALGLLRSLGLGALMLALMAGFVAQERRAVDPILPLDLMIRPVIAISAVGSFAIGGILFGIETFVPLYVQGVLGGTAKEAGRSLTPMFLAWSVSVTLAAKAVARWGFRGAGVVGSCLITLGALALVAGAAHPSTARATFAAALVVVGTGMGPTSLSFLLAVQHSVSWGRRGVATGSILFSRTIGGTIGVGLLGGVLSWELARALARAGAAGVDVGSALRPESHHLLSADHLALVQTSLGHSLWSVFLATAALAAGCLLCATQLPSLARAQAYADADSEAEAVGVDDLIVAAKAGEA